MKRYFYLILIYACLITLAGCTAKQNGKSVFYVSKSGDDSWSGKLSEPNSSKTDGPFATFEKARNAIRTFKLTEPLPEGGITVYIRSGVYEITKTLKLTTDDSGTESSPVVWSAYPEEKVIFSGGKILSGFEAVTDPDVLVRIPKTISDK